MGLNWDPLFCGSPSFKFASRTVATKSAAIRLSRHLHSISEWNYWLSEFAVMNSFVSFDWWCCLSAPSPNYGCSLSHLVALAEFNALNLVQVNPYSTDYKYTHTIDYLSFTYSKWEQIFESAGNTTFLCSNSALVSFRKGAIFYCLKIKDTWLQDLLTIRQYQIWLCSGRHWVWFPTRNPCHRAYDCVWS